MYDNVNLTAIPEDQIVAKECRFAIYVGPPDHDKPDLHYIKEAVHLKDGTIVPNVRLEYDRKRPFWVTKKGFRKHEQHKEWELKSKLSQYESTERQMGQKVAAALEMPFLRDLHGVLKVPYVYGIDVASTACVKRSYMDLWKVTSPYTIAELDIEADVVDGTNCPTMVSLMMPSYGGKPGKCHTIITRQFSDKKADFLRLLEIKTQELLVTMLEKFRASSEKEIKFQMSDYKIDFTSEIVANDMEMWVKVFALAHAWQPDFMSIWNMEYEMDKLLESCERYQVDPVDFMCDPRIPKEYRNFEYIKGKAQKVTASDKKMPIKPAARWHWADFPASFIIIDQMCGYKQTRMGQQEEQSYSLDAILTKELKLTKLHVPEADHIPHATLDWHEFMQKYHPIEYAVYNRFDVIGPALIDEKVRDLSMVMPAMADTSDFRKFPSQPRRTCDAMHWYLLQLEEPRVMGCTSKAMVDDYDDETISREDWIITLPAATITEEGLQIIKELPNAATRVYGHVGDLDVAGSYPNGEVALNTSKETTVREPMRIEGISEEVYRAENMGLSGGHVNATPWCMNMLNFPTLEETMVEFMKDHPEAKLKVTFEEARAFRHGEGAHQYAIPEGVRSSEMIDV